MINYIKTKTILIAIFLVTLVLLHTMSFAETIDVQIKGLDDGVKTTKQQDYKEAVLFAKREAIERSGIEIESITKVKDLIINEDYIDSKAKSVLLPGYDIIDIGYTEDGVYTVMLIGKVYAMYTSKDEKYEDDSINVKKDDTKSSSETDGSKTKEVEAGESETDGVEDDYAEPAPLSPSGERNALLNVKTIPAGAFISIDDRPLGKSPVLKRRVKSGKYQLKAELKGYHKHTRKITLIPGDSPNYQTIELIPIKKLPPTPPEKAKGKALLTVKTIPPGASISLNKKYIGRSPIIKRKIKKGKYILRAELAGYHIYTREVTLFPGKSQANHFSIKLSPYDKPPIRHPRPKTFPQKKW